MGPKPKIKAFKVKGCIIVTKIRDQEMGTEKVLVFQQITIFVFCSLHNEKGT